MSFTRSRAAGVAVTAVPSTGSTNADLLARIEDVPHLGVLATLDQTAGRGRLDRVWVAPAGMTLAASVVVRAPLGQEARGWLPLLAGLAMRDAVTTALPDGVAVGVKWPNDVLVDGRKVCGILAQVARDGSVVVGSGVNLTIPAPALPTPTATSLALAGATGSADALADAVLMAYVPRLGALVDALAAGGGAADAVRASVRDACDTVGRPVRVELPDGSARRATATGIDDTGALVVRDEQGVVTAISVGDVTHLRYE